MVESIRKASNRNTYTATGSTNQYNKQTRVGAPPTVQG